MNNLLLAINIGAIFSKVGYILLAVLILLLMITIHELGHYTAGKVLKFKINEFAVGFGKVLFSRTNKSGERITLRLIPLGGFCAFEGEDETKDSNPDAFNSKAPWKRLIVLFSGVLFNFLSAIVFSVFLLAMVGNGTPQIVAAQGPNASVLNQGDIVLRVNDKTPTFLNGGLPGLTKDIGVGQPVKLTIKRDGKTLTEYIEKYEVEYSDPVTGETKTHAIFNVNMQNYKLTVGESILQAVPFTFKLTGETFEVLGKLITGQFAISDVGGPVTTINVIANASSQNLLNILLLLPLIAVNLVAFNLLPIPALDGARMIFVLIEMIRKKPINRELEGKIHTIGLFMLLGLVVLIDILHLIGL